MIDVSKYAMQNEDGYWMYADPAKVEAWKKTKGANMSTTMSTAEKATVPKNQDRGLGFVEEKKEDGDRAVLTTTAPIGKPNVLHMPTEKEAMALFDKLDDNANGKLSVSELHDVRDYFFKTLQHAPTIMKAHWVADNDQNGFVERSEFEAFLRYAVYHNNYWDKFTKDGKHHVNVLGKESFAAVAKDLDVHDADQAFTMMDTNANGGLSYEEFCGWLAKHTCQWKMSASMTPIDHGRPTRTFFK